MHVTTWREDPTTSRMLLTGLLGTMTQPNYWKLDQEGVASGQTVSPCAAELWGWR